MSLLDSVSEPGEGDRRADIWLRSFGYGFGRAMGIEGGG